MAEAVAREAHSIEAAERRLRLGMSAFTLGAIALTVVALIMRLVALDRESLWLDEGYTLLFSGLPLPSLFTVGGVHEHPPLYYLLVHAFMRVWPSYLVTRAISALAGGLSTLAIYFLGRRLFSAEAGLVAGALVALSPFHLWYSQDGRAYALAGLFVLLSYLCLLRAISGSGLSRWTLYALCTLLALYSEYTTVFAVLPQVLLLRRAPRGFLLSWTGIALGFLPWIGILLRDTATVAGDYWIPMPTVGAVTRTALEMVGLSTPCLSPPCSGQELPALGGYGSALAWLIIAAAVLSAAWAIRRRNVSVSLAAAWLLVPFVIVLALAPLRSLYLDRVFLDASFPLYLLIGAALTRVWAMRWAWLGQAALLILLLGGNAATSGLIYAGRSNPDWRSLARDLRSAYRPGQALMYNPGVLRSLVDAYLPSGWHATRERALWSRSYIDVPGWQRYYPDAVKSDLASRTRVEDALRSRQLTDVTRGVDHTWLVTFDYPGLNDSRRWFSSHGFQPLLSQLYPGDTRLELWSRKGPSSLGPLVLRGAPFGPAWSRRGQVAVHAGTASENGPAAMSTGFSVQPGRAYSVRIQYRAAPPAAPRVKVTVFDALGRVLGTFPRTMWYELPATGVWLSQPFGFIPPPGAQRATLTLQSQWGQVQWRDISIFTEK